MVMAFCATLYFENSLETKKRGQVNMCKPKFLTDIFVLIVCTLKVLNGKVYAITVNFKGYKNEFIHMNRGISQCWSESGLGLGLKGWVRVRVRTRTLPLWTRTRTPPLWTRTQALWTRTLALWTRTQTRTPPRWTRTHSESRWVRWEMFKANLNFHVQ